MGTRIGNPSSPEASMPILCEKRSDSVAVVQMSQITRLYTELALPALEAGGFGPHRVGDFVSDTGELHQLVHLWRFDGDDERRAFWTRLFDDPAFMGFAQRLRPLIRRHEVQLLLAAAWGPHP